MANEKFFNLKYQRSLKSMEVSLVAAAQRATASLNEIIDKMTLSGMTPAAIEANLAADLADGGRVFGEFRRAVKATTEGTIGRVSTDAAIAEFGVDPNFTWIAALVNTCQDCLPRHGEAKSYAEWEDAGLPRTGWSVCKENCQCVLLPEEMAKGRNELRAPLDRKTAMAERAAAKGR